MTKGIVSSLKGEYELNGFEEGKAWQLVESFGSPLPFSGKQNNYFVNNAAKNKAMFLFIEDLVRTAETTEQLKDAEKLLDEARGGKHKLGTLAETYNVEEVSKLRESILAREQWIADKSWTKRTREKILKEENAHNHPHDHSHEESDKKKMQSKTKPQQVKKPKSIASKTKKTKKDSKK